MNFMDGNIISVLNVPAKFDDQYSEHFGYVSMLVTIITEVLEVGGGYSYRRSEFTKIVFSPHRFLKHATFDLYALVVFSLLIFHP